MEPVKKAFRTLGALERRATKKMTLHERKLWGILVFLVRFMALAIPFHFIIWTNFNAYPLQAIVARAVSYLLDISGAGAAIVLADNFIYIREPVEWTIEIIKDCVGWKSFLALSGLMFAVRGARMKDRLAGMASAVPIIFFGNILRIYTSIYASLVFGIEKFGIIHDFLWQVGMMALILITWVAWMRYFRVRL